MTISVNGIPVFDTNRNACVNSLYMERGIAVGSNVSLLTSPMWGESAGYTSGGNTPTTSTNNIEKYPFATTSLTAVAAGTLTVARAGQRINQSSKQHGYHTGGFVLPNSYSNVIDKYPFSTNTNAVDVGDLNGSVSAASGLSSVTHGYTAGGNQPVNPNLQRRIDKFPFSSDSNASNIGDLCACRSAASSASSIDAGFVATGENSASGGYANYIERFSFANETSIANVGTVVACNYGAGGNSSCTDGYITGGKFPPSTFYSCIQKYPFSTTVITTNVGSLCLARLNQGSSSSIVGGFNAGGEIPGSPAISTCIEKFPFSSSVTSSYVGNLICARVGIGGTQV